jgi:hypothetical protein
MTLPLTLLEHNVLQRVSGSHVHALIGEVYSYQANYLMLGTMVDWTAQAGPQGQVQEGLGGSIRLSRGQTRGMASTLVVFMVTQAIDALCSAPA